MGVFRLDELVRLLFQVFVLNWFLVQVESRIALLTRACRRGAIGSAPVL